MMFHGAPIAMDRPASGGVPPLLTLPVREPLALLLLKPCKPPPPPPPAEEDAREPWECAAPPPPPSNRAAPDDPPLSLVVSLLPRIRTEEEASGARPDRCCMSLWW